MTATAWIDQDVRTCVLEFTVPDEPTAMARPRVTVRGGKPHAYVPAKTQQAAWKIRQAAALAWGDRVPLTGPVRVHAMAYIRMPKLSARLAAVAMPSKRPDIDRYLNTLLDGLSPIWHDDAQVVDCRIQKKYARGEAPHWRIAVYDLG